MALLFIPTTLDSLMYSYQKMAKMSPIVLLPFVAFFLLVPSGNSLSKRSLILPNDVDNVHYAVIFDAGSTGSRVHVYCFNEHLDLLKIGDGPDEFQYFEEVKPGLSAYANDPKAAALSLLPLLQNAEQQVPESFRPSTPITLGATAGLRMLDGDASEKILEEVRDLFSKSSLMFSPHMVYVLDGYDEGAYLWVAMNYLLGNLAESRHSRTVATIDLGGGSVQMAYAISQENAQNAPEPAKGEEPYVQAMVLLGARYYVYAHSYLNYGLNAARAAILNLTNKTSSPCITTGYQGFYEYNGVVYKASSRDYGASFRKCKDLAKQVLNIGAPCNYPACSFNGVWNGGGGAGRRNITVASNFYDVAVEAGIIARGVTSKIVRPVNYMNAAQIACTTSVEDMIATFPQLDEKNIPFLCLDLTYEYMLLTEGFRVQRLDTITAVQQVTYQNRSTDVSWTIGSAINVVSSINKPSSYAIA